MWKGSLVSSVILSLLCMSNATAANSSREVSPDQFSGSGHLAGTLVEKGQYQEALNLLESLSKTKNQNAWILANMARAHNGLQKPILALGEAEQAIELDKTSAAGYFARGDANESLGHRDKALADYKKAIELEPSFGRAFARIGKLKATSNDKTALSYFSKAILVGNSDDLSSFYSDRGTASFQLGHNLIGAESDFSKAIHLEPKNILPLYNRGIVHLSMKEPVKALHDFGSVIALEPKNEAAYRDRAIAFAVLGKRTEGLTDFETAISLNPKDALIYTNRAVLQCKNGQYMKAVRDCVKAVELGLDISGLFKTLAFQEWTF